MSNFGQSLRIYLADGIPTGIRWAEIVNWTGQAVACPRIRLAELAAWPEVTRPGVYFLLQGGLGLERGKVYIGESENVRRRLSEQIEAFDFWTEAIVFTNKDDNLTKAHVRYLEARLITLAKSADRYDIVNGNNGTVDPLLPRADKAAMEAFLENLRVMLSSLGHRLLEPLTANAITTPTSINTLVGKSIASPLATTLLTFTTAGITASGYVTDEGFTLLRGSQVKMEHTEATPKNVVALRAAAIDEGQLVADNGHYRLVDDKAFSSSSAAVCFVAGNSRSGPKSWMYQGLSLGQLEQQVLQSIPEEADVESVELSDVESIDASHQE